MNINVCCAGCPSLWCDCSAECLHATEFIQYKIKHKDQPHLLCVLACFWQEKVQKNKLLRLAHAPQFGKDGYITFQAVASTHVLVFRTEQLPFFITWYGLCLCDHLPTTHIHIQNWCISFIFDRLPFICAIYNLCTVMRTVVVLLNYN